MNTAVQVWHKRVLMGSGFRLPRPQNDKSGAAPIEPNTEDVDGWVKPGQGE
jgi:hypothetical protein